MKNFTLQNWIALFFLLSGFPLSAQNQAGDTITIGNRDFNLLSTNLISNAGFENGFTGWTDATTTAATLTSAKFTIATTGGVNNSKYLIGLNNENSSSSGSIGTGWNIASGKSYLFAYKVKYLNSATAAGSQLYLKISRTNDKASNAEPNILIDATQVGGNGEWTQNFVYFTNSNPSYSYLVARFRWLNNLYGFDDFALYEAVEVANTVELQTLINNAQLIYNVENKGASEFLSAIQTAQNYLNSASAAEIKTAVLNLQAAIQTYQYVNASPTHPLDMTSFIVNQGFDNNDAEGWNGGGTVNYHEVEYYQKTFNLYQTIHGLPAGRYRLKAQGFERPKSNDSGLAYKNGTETIYAKIYARSNGYAEANTPFNSIYKHTFTGAGSSNGYVNTMAAAETLLANTAMSYYDMTLDNIFLDAGETLTIGAKSNFQQTGYWVLLDNFKLEYLGSITINDRVVALNGRIAEAQYLQSQQIQNSSVTTLNTTISQAQAAVAANPTDSTNISNAKTAIDTAIANAYISLDAYQKLSKAIEGVNQILSFLDKENEITTLNNAIATANQQYNNLDLSLAEINAATTTLINTTRSVGKQIYNPYWMLGDIYNPSNNWSIERSKQSKNWILFWEPGFGDNPGTIVDDCLALAEKSFIYYADSLKFITRGSSKTDNYKMIIRLRYSTEWEASGSGVDDMIGLLTLTPWALTSRGGQTIAHEVGHCFQYQTHCDNNDTNGWMYGFGENASGGNGWWEQCAQWQAYKIFPEQQFTNEWFTGYLNNAHKNMLNEAYRYNDYFIQDYWTYLRGMDVIGMLWSKSVKPEDPIETYKRLYSLDQNKFNDEMWDCAARFATWDIPALKSYGANYINSRAQPKMNNIGNYVWRIDSTACLENYGHNIIRINIPITSKTITAYFDGLAGADGFRKKLVAYAGWKFGFVALLYDGTRVYSEIKSAKITQNEGDETLTFVCPDNCYKLWFVVSGAPAVHWRHAWDDNDSNDEQWPYQVSFNNTNILGYSNNVIDAVDYQLEQNLKVYSKENTLFIDELPMDAKLKIYDSLGKCFVCRNTKSTNFSAFLPKGAYIVLVETNQGIVNKKVIVH